MTNYRQTMADALEFMNIMREYRILERELTDTEKKRREEIAQDMDDGDFKSRYGDRWKEVKMAVATKQAKKESFGEVELDEDNMDLMKKAAKGAMQTIKFKDGKLKIDSFTASGIMSVYDKVNPKNKASIEKMINSGTKAQIMKLQSLAMKGAKEGKGPLATVDEAAYYMPKGRELKALKKLMSQPTVPIGNMDSEDNILAKGQLPIGDKELDKDLEDLYDKKGSKGDAKSIIKKAMKRLGIKEDLGEGTWHIGKDRVGLKKLLSKPIKLGKEGEDAVDTIAPHIGDDTLYDDLYAAGKKDPKGDARPAIKKAMKRLGIKEEVLDEKVGYALVVQQKDGSREIVAKGSKAAMKKAAKEHGGLKQGKTFLTLTAKEVGDKVLGIGEAVAEVLSRQVDEKIVRDQTYFKSYSDAVSHALKYTKDRGYEVDEDDFANKVTHGPRKPSEGKTVSQRIDVTKNGKPVKKQLSFQVYNKGGKNPYELNVYVEETELDEDFTKKDFDDNEDKNYHSENAVELAKKFGTKEEIKRMTAIHKAHMKRRHITSSDQKERDKLVMKYYPKLESVDLGEKFDVKTAATKKGKISVTSFDSLDDAKKHLAAMEKKGHKGIISKDGKPVKEEVELDEAPAKVWHLANKKFNLIFDKDGYTLVKQGSGKETKLKAKTPTDATAELVKRGYRESVELDEASEKDILNALKKEKIGGYFSGGTLYVAQRALETVRDLLRGMKLKSMPTLVGEAVSGPTRMNIQKYYDKQSGSQTNRIAATEKAFKIKNLKVRSDGTVVDFSEELEESGMSDLHQHIKDGKSAKEIAKLMKVDVKTIEKLMKGFNEKVDPADVDDDASDDDVKAAGMNIMMQLRKAVSLRGKFKVEFGDKKKKEVPVRIAQEVQKKYNSLRRPADKEEFQAKIAKSYEDMLKALKENAIKEKTGQDRIVGLVSDKLKEKKYG